MRKRNQFRVLLITDTSKWYFDCFRIEIFYFGYLYSKVYGTTVEVCLAKTIILLSTVPPFITGSNVDIHLIALSLIN
jgi:hypothetical protein